MKRLTLFTAALFLAATMFASITYELNGGVTNPKGWEDKQDMYNAFLKTAAPFLTGDVSQIIPLDSLKDKTLGNEGHFAKHISAVDLKIKEDSAMKADFSWLFKHMDNVIAATAGAAANTSSAIMRYNIGGFFADGWQSGWPYGGDYTAKGVSFYNTYKETWQAAYANPTNPTDSVALNAPYKEGFSFDAWYDNAAFIGKPITHVDSTTTGTLYAKWVEYIPTIAEVLALDDGASTPVAGSVTYVRDGQFYLQDHTGAIQCYKNGHGLTAGEYVVLRGGTKTTRYKTNPQISGNLTIEKRRIGAWMPKTTTLATIAADTIDYTLQSHFVRVLGVLINWSHDSLFLKKDDAKVYIFKHGLDKRELPEGLKVNANFIVSYYQGKPSCYTSVENIERSSYPSIDSYVYPARGEYTLQNKWIYSLNEGNFLDNSPGASGYVRGMVAKAGKMYFIDREHAQLVVVDGATSEMYEPIKIKGAFTQVYKDQAGNDSVGAANVALPYNDLKKDNVGNLLIGGSITNTQQTFQVWKVDEETGNATLVVEETINKNPACAEIDRLSLSAFGVWGDVDNHAIIMAADANSMTVFKWTIEEGKQVGVSEVIDLYVALGADNSYLIREGAMIAHPGTAPQIFPVDADYFYLDGKATFPTLFNMDGTLVCDLKDCKAGIKVGNNEGDTCTLNQGHNGLVEFQIGEDYFLLFAATNTAGNPASAFALYKYADENKSFEDMEPMWFFPNAGMGSATNAYCAAIPYVEVNQQTGRAEIYIFAADNGYGMYEFQGVPAGEDNINVTGISLNKTEAEVYVDNTIRLTAMVYPDNATNKEITWSSSNTNVATVENGLITAHSVGSAVITVTTEEGNYTATCTITVTKREVITLYVQKPANWEDIYLYTWLDGTASQPHGEWPGTPMTQINEEGWYYYTFDPSVKNISYIFNIGSSSWQTKDLNTSHSTYTIFDSNGGGYWVFTLAEFMEYLGDYGYSPKYCNLAYDSSTQTTSWSCAEPPQPPSVEVTPDDNSADFVWSNVEDAYSYTLIIWANIEQTEKVCTLTFNAQGQLTNIDFSRHKPAASHRTTSGLSFTVTGLESGRTYAYSLNSYDSSNNLIDSYTGQFTTTSSSTTTAIEDLIENGASTIRKVLEDGTIYILRNGEKYTIDGRKL